MQKFVIKLFVSGFLGLLVSFSIISCETENAKVEDTLIEINGQKFKNVEMDGCEYMYYWAGGYGGMLSHKGSCKYCREWQIKTIDSIIKSNKVKL